VVDIQRKQYMSMSVAGNYILAMESF